MPPATARRPSKRGGCEVRALPCGFPCQTTSGGVASTPQRGRVRHELAARMGLAGGRLRRSAGRIRNLERCAVGGASGNSVHAPLSRAVARMPQRAASRSQTPVSNGGGVKRETPHVDFSFKKRLQEKIDFSAAKAAARLPTSLDQAGGSLGEI